MGLMCCWVLNLTLVEGVDAMKCLSARHIAPSLLLVGATLSSVCAWSMDEMSDGQLATTIGQDGIAFLIAPPKLTVAQQNVAGQAVLTQTNGLIVGAALLHDKDGFTGYTSAGALILGDAHQANAANAVGVQLGVYASTPLSVTMDVSSGKVTSGLGGTKPLVNITVALPSDLLIRTGDVSLGVSNRTGIAVGAAGATAASAAVGGTSGAAYKIINSADIALGVATSFSLQLGNIQQGSLLTLSSFNIPSITFGMSLASPNGGAVASANLTASAVITNFNLTGAQVDAVTDIGLALGGSSTGVGGLILQDASFSVGGLQLNDVTAGTSGNSNANFGGMKNASMGSFGISNMTVSNLKIGVSGM
jgi:hypothetical protein